MDSILHIANTECSHFSFSNFCAIVANLCCPARARLILLLLGVLKPYKQFFTMIYVTSVVLSASTQVNFGLSCAKHDNDKSWNIYYMNRQLVWGRRAKPMSSWTFWHLCSRLCSRCLPFVEGHPRWMFPDGSTVMDNSCDEDKWIHACQVNEENKMMIVNYKWKSRRSGIIFFNEEVGTKIASPASVLVSGNVGIDQLWLWVICLQPRCCFCIEQDSVRPMVNASWLLGL